MLGKRKREGRTLRDATQIEQQSRANRDVSAQQDVFRQHFELMFSPLPVPNVKVADAEILETSGYGSSCSDDEEEEEWTGLSEEEDGKAQGSPVVEIVDYTVPIDEAIEETGRAHRRAYLSSRPPKDGPTKITEDTTEKTSQESAAERLNLKHDLDLQRLLQESDLLKKLKTSKVPAMERQKALDMRLQALGAKESIFAQKTMPFSHRKGIAAKAVSSDLKRRKEAKENGIILEKPVKKKSLPMRRDRTVDAPGVGKFTNGGTLKLSRRDVASIQGGSGSASGAKRKDNRR